MKKSILLASLFYSFVESISFFIGIALYTPLFLAKDSVYKDPINWLRQPEFLLGVILGAYGLGLFLGSVFLLKLSDQRTKKQPLQIVMLIYILGNLGLGFFFPLANVWMMILFSFITGLGSSGTQLIYRVVQNSETDKKKREKALKNLVGISLFAMVIGPAFGSVFVANSGIQLGVPFFVLSILGGVSMVFTHFSFGRNTSIDRAVQQETFSIFAMREIFVLGTSFFLNILIVDALLVAVPTLVVLGFNVSKDWIALFFVYGGLVAIFSKVFIARFVSQFFSLRGIYLASLFGLATSCFSFLLCSTPEEFYVPFTFFGIFATLVLSKGNEFILAITQMKSFGIVTGLFESTFAMAYLFATLLIGYFAAIDSLIPLVGLFALGVLNFFLALHGARKFAIG